MPMRSSPSVASALSAATAPATSSVSRSPLHASASYASLPSNAMNQKRNRKPMGRAGSFLPLHHHHHQQQKPPLSFARKSVVHALVAALGAAWCACLLALAYYHCSDASPTNAAISSSIPLPLPKTKISVVLMNYGRPRMIRESTMMRTLLQHPSVDELLLLHSNPKTAFEFVHEKVVNVDAIQHNEEIGLSLRFYFCQTAKNAWVLHLDDDMEFTTAALNDLILEFARNPKRIVGRFGRDLNTHNVATAFFNGYDSTNRHKQTEVILTKLMLMERDMCTNFFEYTDLLWDDVVLPDGEGPLWNGEDIFMSLVANHVYGNDKKNKTPDKNNFAMDWLDVRQASDELKDYSDGKLDISGGMSGIRIWDWKWWQTLLRRNRHYAYRGKLWQTAKARLAAIGEI